MATIEEIEKANMEFEERLSKVQEASFKIRDIIDKVKQAILTNEEGVVIIDLTPEQKTALLEEYNNRKQALIDAVNDLL